MGYGCYRVGSPQGEANQLYGELKCSIDSRKAAPLPYLER